jgi:hypothetical protein
MFAVDETLVMGRKDSAALSPLYANNAAPTHDDVIVNSILNPLDGRMR